LLHEAALSAQVSVVQHLLDNQADIQAVDKVSGVYHVVHYLGWQYVQNWRVLLRTRGVPESLSSNDCCLDYTNTILEYLMATREWQ